MSGTRTHSRGWPARLVQALALALICALLAFATEQSSRLDTHLGTIAAIGLLLLVGTLLSELLEPIGLPHLSAYLLSGVLVGPFVLALVDHETVAELSPVNTLALALIAIAGGAELRLPSLWRSRRSLGWALLLQSAIGLVALTGAFVALAPYIPFAQGRPLPALLAIGLLWGVLGVSRSPSACLAILSQTRAKGPLAEFGLAFIMASDVVVIVLMASVLVVARALLTPGSPLAFDDFGLLAHEILGSVSMGTSLGLVLCIYLKLVGRNLPLILLALGFGMTEFMRYVHIDPILSFLTAGFVVQNLSAQGEKLLRAVEQLGSTVFVVFFATAGAHLDLPLLQSLWPTALILCALRALATYGAATLSSRVTGDVPTVRRFGWTPLVSQAGLTLGLSLVVVRAFPSFGDGFRSLVVATVAINEVVGPVLFKFALDRSGETSPSSEATRSRSSSGLAAAARSHGQE